MAARYPLEQAYAWSYAWRLDNEMSVIFLSNFKAFLLFVFLIRKLSYNEKALLLYANPF